MIINKAKPADWKGIHVLRCCHCIGRNRTYYLMYCDVVKEMPNGKVKLKVYGNRYWRTDGFKYRYVEKRKISEYKTHFRD